MANLDEMNKQYILCNHLMMTTGNFDRTSMFVLNRARSKAKHFWDYPANEQKFEQLVRSNRKEGKGVEEDHNNLGRLPLQLQLEISSAIQSTF